MLSASKVRPFRISIFEFRIFSISIGFTEHLFSLFTDPVSRKNRKDQVPKKCRISFLFFSASPARRALWRVGLSHVIFDSTCFLNNACAFNCLLYAFYRYNDQNIISYNRFFFNYVVKVSYFIIFFF
jgi:hypothetical protein